VAAVGWPPSGSPSDEGVHCYSSPTCVAVLGEYSIIVEALDGGLNVADLQRITLGLKPVGVADRAAWVPVNG
jgi:ligand-binding SRPBCC domain-containing protein